MTYQSEPNHKIEQKIAKAKIRHMSNSKWRKLFRVLHELPTGFDRIGLKLIGRPVTGIELPGPEFPQIDRFSLGSRLKDIPFSHIEYIGLSNQKLNNEALKSYLLPHAQWPIQEEDEGLLIIGYEWH